MADEIRDAILENATGPASASGDGQSVTQHTIADQIAADKHLAAKQAMSRADRGIYRDRLVPPGSV